jgi:hypothetical protein
MNRKITFLLVVFLAFVLLGLIFNSVKEGYPRGHGGSSGGSSKEDKDEEKEKKKETFATVVFLKILSFI